MAEDPTVCIYHANCRDGFTAAWIIHQRFGGDVHYIPADYGQTPPITACIGQNVVITDFSYPPAAMRAINAVVKSLVVLDHHTTAQADLQPMIDSGEIRGVFDMERSGSLLTWDWYRSGEPVPLMLAHVNDRDLWRFAIAGTREIDAVLSSYPFEFETWTEIWDILSNGDVVEKRRVRDAGVAILRARTSDIVNAIPGMQRRMKIGGYHVPVINVPKHMGSDACEVLAIGEPFAAYYFDRADGFREFGLRSRPPDGIDVSKIARAHGGGGHKGAAGFRLRIGQVDEI